MKRETEHLDMIMRLQTQITGYPEDNPDVPELVCLGKMLRRYTHTNSYSILFSLTPSFSL